MLQLIAKNGTVKVIECNLRASRSCPFSSKVQKRSYRNARMETLFYISVPFKVVSPANAFLP